MSRMIVLIALGIVLSVGGVAVSAQPATPQAGPECSMRPLEPTVLGETVAAGFDPAPALAPSDEPVPARGFAGIFTVLSRNIACTNANQPLRALAYFTDRYLAERFSGPDGEDELGHLLAAATRSPASAAHEDQLVLVSVSELVAYADGRIGALVTTTNVEEEFTDLLVFVETVDGWRIDQVVPGATDSDVGTPTASSQEFTYPVG